ncbi:hypothetical protein E5AUHO_35870 [Citrobacter freundii]|nr:hypothetical protein E5AUHO_35870 [Citrobacter freundii]
MLRDTSTECMSTRLAIMHSAVSAKAVCLNMEARSRLMFKLYVPATIITHE